MLRKSYFVRPHVHSTYSAGGGSIFWCRWCPLGFRALRGACGRCPVIPHQCFADISCESRSKTAVWTSESCNQRFIMVQVLWWERNHTMQPCIGHTSAALISRPYTFHSGHVWHFSFFRALWNSERLHLMSFFSTGGSYKVDVPYERNFEGMLEASSRVCLFSSLCSDEKGELMCVRFFPSSICAIIVLLLLWMS